MRFQITGSWGWAVGDKLIPGGTILDFDDPTDQWAQLAKAQKWLPPNCLCLDQESWEAVKAKGYEPNVRPLPGEGVQV